MIEGLKNEAWPPALTTSERDKVQQSSCRDHYLLAQTYAAEILLQRPDLDDDHLAQAVGNKTGLRVNLARAALY
jgi:hypothetical protein